LGEGGLVLNSEDGDGRAIVNSSITPRGLLYRILSDLLLKVESCSLFFVIDKGGIIGTAIEERLLAAITF
jgi:hypothetical protein